jgi:lipopolysaccharide biosynthesis glycosyltransferase
MPYALALRESLIEFNSDAILYIFVSDHGKDLKEHIEGNYSNTYVLYPDELCEQGLGRELFEKYHAVEKDSFRWSMKSVLLQHLLQNLGFSAVIYVDSDIHFYDDFSFLFELLECNSMILTPHNRSLFPQASPENFSKNFTEGIFNAGFVGASIDAIPALEWWGQACSYKCDKDISNGFFDDQKYLDILPVRFDHVLPIQHKGCNVAEWNINDCQRSIVDGEVLINGNYPIVFIHFVTYTIIRILNGKDPYLLPHLNLYSTRVNKYNNNIDVINTAKAITVCNKSSNVINRIAKLYNAMAGK